MEALHLFPQQLAVQQGPLVKRRVFQLLSYPHTAVTAHTSAQSPQGGGQGLPLRRKEWQDLALRGKAKRQQLIPLRSPSLDVIHHRRAAVLHRAARPVPLSA